jgi:hypothetical protein
VHRLPIGEVRQNFSDVVNLVENAKHRIVVQVGTSDRAALVPLEDLALLENLDGRNEVAVEHVAVDEVRRHLEADLNEVAARKERIVLQRGGVDVAALVPHRDVAVLEDLDQRLELDAAKRLLERDISAEE